MVNFSFSYPDQINRKPCLSPFLVGDKATGWYRCQITFVDLIMKPPKKILEHEKVLQELADILEDLKKQNIAPKCCSV